MVAMEIGIPCNLLLDNDSGIERRHKHDHLLLILHIQNTSELAIVQTDAVGAGATLITDWLLNIINILDPSGSLHRYFPSMCLSA